MDKILEIKVDRFTTVRRAVGKREPAGRVVLPEYQRDSRLAPPQIDPDTHRPIEGGSTKIITSGKETSPLGFFKCKYCGIRAEKPQDPKERKKVRKLMKKHVRTCKVVNGDE